MERVDDTMSLRIEAHLVPYPGNKLAYNTCRHWMYAPCWYQEENKTFFVQKEWSHDIQDFCSPVQDIKVEVVNVLPVKIPHVNQSEIAIVKAFAKFVAAQHRYHIFLEWMRNCKSVESHAPEILGAPVNIPGDLYGYPQRPVGHARPAYRGQSG